MAYERHLLAEGYELFQPSTLEAAFFNYHEYFERNEISIQWRIKVFVFLSNGRVTVIWLPVLFYLVDGYMGCLWCGTNLTVYYFLIIIQNCSKIIEQFRDLEGNTTIAVTKYFNINKRTRGMLRENIHIWECKNKRNGLVW